MTKRNMDEINGIIVYNSSITNPNTHLQVQVFLVGQTVLEIYLLTNVNKAPKTKTMDSFSN
jgi:hypothetical protein